MTTTWVVGASGLLGQHVVAAVRDAGHHLVSVPVPWNDAPNARRALAAGVDELLRASGGGRWNLVWVAGAGVVGTSPEVLAAEYDAFVALLDRLRGRVEQGAPSGTVFLASSAGGVYAGAADPPFTEESPVRALAPYGVHKLRMEAEARDLAAAAGASVLIGRISNLYGPGQDLAKAQGLVSQLARAQLLRQPISLYVSLDTTRDYLAVGDCAAMIVRGLETMSRRPAGTGAVVKILASGRPTTIAALLGEFRRLLRRGAPVVLADSPNARFQVRDLRMRSTVWTDLDVLARTTLPSGIMAVVEDLSQRLRAGTLRQR